MRFVAVAVLFMFSACVSQEQSPMSKPMSPSWRESQTSEALWQAYFNIDYHGTLFKKLTKVCGKLRPPSVTPDYKGAVSRSQYNAAKRHAKDLPKVKKCILDNMSQVVNDRIADFKEMDTIATFGIQQYRNGNFQLDDRLRLFERMIETEIGARNRKAEIERELTIVREEFSVATERAIGSLNQAEKGRGIARSHAALIWADGLSGAAQDLSASMHASVNASRAHAGLPTLMSASERAQMDRNLADLHFEAESFESWDEATPKATLHSQEDMKCPFVPEAGYRTCGEWREFNGLEDDRAYPSAASVEN